MDVTLVVSGIGLLLFAVVMLLAYLWLERGSFLDPVAVSWAGYILFIPVAMIGTGALYPDRDTLSVGMMGCCLMILGTVAYTVGLYTGKAFQFVRHLPSPRPTISKAQIWTAMLLSIAMLPAFPLLSPWLVEVAGSSAGTVLYDAMFTITLIGVIGLVMLRGSPISRIVMAAVTVAACVAIVWTIWSRRPLAGVIIAVTGLIYHFRIARKPAITKLWYFGGLIASVLVLVLYLEATRGARFYGRAAEAVSSSTFSSENLQSTFAGVEMNYRIYEFVLQHVPREHPYLYGSGYVPAFVWWPRAIWPSKPVSSGFAVTQMWFGKEGELNLPTNFGLPTMGEAYVNFGILGVVVILFLIGRVVRIMNSYLQMHNNNVIAWTAWLMITPDMATEWRGDFTSMTVQALLRVMGFLAVVWIACKLIPSRSVSPLVPAGQKLPWNRVQPMALSSRTSVRRGG